MKERVRNTSLAYLVLMLFSILIITQIEVIHSNITAQIGNPIDWSVFSKNETTYLSKHDLKDGNPIESSVFSKSETTYLTKHGLKDLLEKHKKKVILQVLEIQKLPNNDPGKTDKYRYQCFIEDSLFIYCNKGCNLRW